MACARCWEGSQLVAGARINVYFKSARIRRLFQTRKQLNRTGFDYRRLLVNFVPGEAARLTGGRHGC